MKSRRFQHSYRASASKLHRAVGDVLYTDSRFAHHKVFQEYPVERINESFDLRGCHFDWVILDLHLVIECMGEQHEKPCSFGGDDAQAIQAFKETQIRDKAKKDAAISAGYVYMTVGFRELKSISGDFLWSRYMELLSTSSPVTPTPRARSERSEKDKIRLEKAKEYRKQRYRQMKEWRKTHA